MTMGTLLSVRDCSFRYPDGAFELDRVSLDVAAGELLGLVGPNGSGKSTLLRLMAGILKASPDQVRVAGRPVSSYRRRELAREVAFLPQGPPIAFDLTVREVVALGRYPHQGPLGLASREDERVIEEVLREADAWAMADRFFSTLSGGERQRVLVASILAQQPAIMLLDEPSAALDIHHRSHVFDLLRGLTARGIAIVVVTHDLNTASEFCDRLALLCAGCLVAVGPPEEVIREDLLSEAYETPVRVVAHPLTGAPMVLVLGRRTHGAHAT